MLYENYKIMFSNYPDVVNFKQMRKMLGNIGVSLGYKLLRDKTIRSTKIGRDYKILKIDVISYLINKND